MQVGEARWVEVIDEKCLEVGEALQILQGDGGEMFVDVFVFF